MNKAGTTMKLPSNAASVTACCWLLVFSHWFHSLRESLELGIHRIAEFQIHINWQDCMLSTSLCWWCYELLSLAEFLPIANTHMSQEGGWQLESKAPHTMASKQSFLGSMAKPVAIVNNVLGGCWYDSHNPKRCRTIDLRPIEPWTTSKNLAVASHQKTLYQFYMLSLDMDISIQKTHTTHTVSHIFHHLVDQVRHCPW